jgi:hypothetical protein
MRETNTPENTPEKPSYWSCGAMIPDEIRKGYDWGGYMR